MKHYIFSATAFALGAVLLTWAAIPWDAGQEALLGFLLLAGPSIVFSVAVAAIAIVVYRRWHGLLLVLLSPIIYISGGRVLFSEALGIWSPLIVSLASALVFLAATRLLLFRTCPWIVTLGWGSLAVLAGIPMFPPVNKFDADYLGNFWWWGLHIMIWYVVVGFALDKMAGKSRLAATASSTTAPSTTASSTTASSTTASSTTASSTAAHQE